MDLSAYFVNVVKAGAIKIFTKPSLLVVIIFSIQCCFSTLYLKRFRYGPLEGIHRKWTNLSAKDGNNTNDPVFLFNNWAILYC
ncbi:DUF418 domain-containing protein [Lysinibacillus sp. NPDC059133]|uniref:DUF418 domain-containing protein n=1 Tax=Lysinibacillus sp. NPDC059133 TaxID=3346737 RepID=UPI00367687BE